jgi:tRNA pseudouridine55 synthase
MDGLLLVDKPAGPTSHDVVVRMRRALRERRIGHTGTLDPAATGLLPLVVGRATRLARFLSGAGKTYEAVIRLGVSTDSGDSHGRPVGTAHDGPLPSPDEIARALDQFCGTYLQQPPAFSARKIAGRRSYRLARQARDAVDLIRPAPTRVTVDHIAMLTYEQADLKLVISCSAGFYVRSLAHDLGQHLGTGAHLTALRRTRAGTFLLDRAIELAAAEADPERARAALIPMAEMMPGWSTVVLTADGVRHARSGRDLGPADFGGSEGDAAAIAPAGRVRLIDGAGELVGIGEPAGAPGFLHPSVVLM